MSYETVMAWAKEVKDAAVEAALEENDLYEKDHKYADGPHGPVYVPIDEDQLPWPEDPASDGAISGIEGQFQFLADRDRETVASKKEALGGTKLLVKTEINHLDYVAEKLGGKNAEWQGATADNFDIRARGYQNAREVHESMALVLDNGLETIMDMLDNAGQGVEQVKKETVTALNAIRDQNQEAATERTITALTMGINAVTTDIGGLVKSQLTTLAGAAGKMALGGDTVKTALSNMESALGEVETWMTDRDKEVSKNLQKSASWAESHKRKLVPFEPMMVKKAGPANEDGLYPSATGPQE